MQQKAERLKAELHLKFACAPYDRILALFDGRVKIGNVTLQPVPIEQPMEIFSRMLSKQEFDVSEMSLTHCFVLPALGKAPFANLPVFPSRMFRHGFIFVNVDSGIKTPADLEHKRIGVQGFQMTAAVWIRGLLREEYGLSFADVEWFEGGVNEATPGTDTTAMHPKGIRVHRIPQDKTLNAMLAAGEIDAVIGAIVPDALFQKDHVVRLIPNYHDVERAYFQRTGIFPIMHGLVIRSALIEQHPWLASSVVAACTEAKQRALEGLRFSGSLRYMLPWLRESVEEVDAVFDGDAWRYGVNENRAALTAFGRYLVEDGLLERQPDVDVLFS